MTTETTCPFALPLRVVHGSGNFTGHYIYENGGNWSLNEIATLYGSATAERSAEIVHRVNVHDELVEALRLAREQLGLGAQLPAEHLFKTIGAVDAALDKAEVR